MSHSPAFSVVRPSSPSGLVLVSAVYRDHESAPHAHEETAIGLCDSAIDEFHCGTFAGHVPAGSILAIEAGSIHWDRCAAGSIRMIYAPVALTGPLLFEDPVVTDATVWNAAGALFETTDIETAWAVFAGVLHGRRWVSAGSRNSPFDGLKTRLRTEQPRLDLLAAEAGLSPSAFLRRFRKTEGCTPHEYSRQARITRAAGRIQHGAGTAEAAVAEDFFDQSHFHRHFRRIYAVSPGVFRARNSVQS